MYVCGLWYQLLLVHTTLWLYGHYAGLFPAMACMIISCVIVKTESEVCARGQGDSITVFIIACHTFGLQNNDAILLCTRPFAKKQAW